MAVASKIDAGLGENFSVFMQPLCTDWPLYPVTFFLCYILVFLTFFTTVDLIIFVRITRVGLVNRFLLITVFTFGFLFPPLDDWRNSDKLSTEASLYPWGPWVLQFLWKRQFHEHFGWRFFLRKPVWVLKYGQMQE